mmetsp:Transcript_28436/g.61135  ORF Transcript_28436/g.61135 Transcript_28436/m.61135 type:complete len:221 (+) Transcript_28436:765-1427(+)
MRVHMCRLRRSQARHLYNLVERDEVARLRGVRGRRRRGRTGRLLRWRRRQRTHLFCRRLVKQAIDGCLERAKLLEHSRGHLRFEAHRNERCHVCIILRGGLSAAATTVRLAAARCTVLLVAWLARALLVMLYVHLVVVAGAPELSSTVEWAREAAHVAEAAVGHAGGVLPSLVLPPCLVDGISRSLPCAFPCLLRIELSQLVDCLILSSLLNEMSRCFLH